jgi:hypothetical protein
MVLPGIPTVNSLETPGHAIAVVQQRQLTPPFEMLPAAGRPAEYLMPYWLETGPTMPAAAGYNALWRDFSTRGGSRHGLIASRRSLKGQITLPFCKAARPASLRRHVPGV